MSTSNRSDRGARGGGAPDAPVAPVAPVAGEAAVGALLAIGAAALSSPGDLTMPGCGFHPAWLPIVLLAARYGTRGLFVALGVVWGLLLATDVALHGSAAL